MWPHSLCAQCQHRRETGNARGSVFWMCARSREDRRYPKYPPQPQLRCAGYEAIEPPPALPGQP